MANNRPIIYVATPFAPLPSDPDPQANVVFAREVCYRVAQAGGCPYAPHLLFPQFLDDNVENERALGIANGLTMMSVAAEVWFLLPSWRKEHSRGMKAELEAATKLGKKVRVIGWPDGLATLLDGMLAVPRST